MAGGTSHVAQVLCLVTVCLLVQHTRTELFTALVELQKVLQAEYQISRDMRHYIQLEENRLASLRKIADDYEQHSVTALKDADQHLSNPINAFLLVKRFTSDWDSVEGLIRNNTADDFMSRLQLLADIFPSQEDLSGAATALLRLQDTYALSTSKIAKGELQGLKTSPVLSAADCFELGKHAYNDNDYYHTVLWMDEALEKLDREDRKPTIKKSVILDYLSFATSMQGNTVQAYELTKELLYIGNIRAAYNLTLEWLKVEPDHIRAQNNKRYYEQLLAEEEGNKRKGDIGSPPDAIKNKRHLDDYRSSEEFQTYEALCRGEDIFPYKDQHKLTCQFRRHAPIFYIRPLKEEIMYLDPLIVVYHDIMVDSEVAKIKEVASPRLKRATVQNPQTGLLETAYYRVSKSAWLHDYEDPLIQAVSTKVRWLSNLTLDTAEELQVVNYGIGGHYEPHYDFARKREQDAFDPWRGNRIATAIFYKEETGGFDQSSGNRIATAIFYMTDVKAGGATVFTSLGVKLWPTKGSVALWYNLVRNGEGDYRTRHAACPVLTGNKWVANKWIHEKGQELVRPCLLDPNV